MTIVTHGLVAVLCAGLADAGKANAIAACVGAALPDIDTQHSAIGRIFFFISKPLEDQFGHRGIIHGLPLWLSLFILSFFLHHDLMTWIMAGAVSHCVIDCYNVSGVRLFAPFSEKNFVILKRDWRIYVGSVHEILFAILILVMITASGYMQTIGGWRKAINLIARSPQITVEEFTRASNLRCRVEGMFRYGDGRQESVSWLAVGIENGSNLVLWNGKRLVRNGKNGKFLRSVLKHNEESWSLSIMDGFVTSDTPCFFFDGKKWHYAAPGDLMFGSIKSVSGGIFKLKVHKRE